MQLAVAHLDNWLFLAFVAVAFLFRRLAGGSGKTTKDLDETTRRSTSTPPPPVREMEESDTDRIRKFLEALGQPPGTKPPAPVSRRSDIPPRPVAPVQPPRVFPTPPKRKFVREERRTPEVSPPVPVQVERAAREQKVFVPRSTEPPPPLPVVSSEAYAITSKMTPSSAMKTDLVSLLRSPDGLRNAMILREIFGPPRSLQDVDLGPSRTGG